MVKALALQGWGLEFKSPEPIHRGNGDPPEYHLRKVDPQVKLTGNISHIVELCLGLTENPSSMNMIEEQPRAGLQPWAESLSPSRYAGPLDHSAHPAEDLWN